MEDKKCVIIIDKDLPLGLIANTAAVLSLTLGKHIDGIIGQDLLDSDENVHAGITTIPIPILKGDSELVKAIRYQLFGDINVFVVDFCDAAQTTKNYDDYSNKLKATPASNLVYLGIALYGDKKTINKLTGNLPLLR